MYFMKHENTVLLFCHVFSLVGPHRSEGDFLGFDEKLLHLHSYIQLLTLFYILAILLSKINEISGSMYFLFPEVDNDLSHFGIHSSDCLHKAHFHPHKKITWPT